MPKVFKNGNSLVVTLPKEILINHGLKEGSEIFMEDKGEEITIKSKKKILAPNVDAKFMKMVEDFMDEHEDVLQELAKR